MAPQQPRGSLDPMSPADYVAPTRDSVTRSYATNLSTPQHTSVHSHMRPAPLHTPTMNPNAGNTGYRREPKLTTEDNTQPRFELFLLGDGEKKVTEEADTREFNSLSSSKAPNICCFLMDFLITRQPSLSIVDFHTCAFLN